MMMMMMMAFMKKFRNDFRAFYNFVSHFDSYSYLRLARQIVLLDKIN